MDPLVVSLAERPDLGRVFDAFPDSWPEFMFHDPISATLFDAMVAANPATNLLAVDPTDPTRPFARACGFAFSCADVTRLAVPVTVLDPAAPDAGASAGAAAGPLAAADSAPVGLPPGGYDDVLLVAAADRLAVRAGNVLAALEVTVRPDARGRGLSGMMLRQLRSRAAAAGYPALVVPVRPVRQAPVPGRVDGPLPAPDPR